MRQLGIIVLLILCFACEKEKTATKPKAKTSTPKVDKVKGEQDAKQTAFLNTLKTGSNGEIEDAAKQCFTVNEDAASFEKALKTANEKNEKDGAVVYKFWLRGKNPKIEGDGWIEVVTKDQKAPKVTSVRCVILKK